MKKSQIEGWRTLTHPLPQAQGKASFPLSAYSEFMPPVHLGVAPYDGEIDGELYDENDPHGWRVTEVEEAYALKPGMENIAAQVLEQLVALGRGLAAPLIRGYQGRNLEKNPYWSPALADRAGRLAHERFVILLPLALSKTQDDLGRVRWTFFGGSEQGPEQAFWQSFYAAPNREMPASAALDFILRMLRQVYGEPARDATALWNLGFRILPSLENDRFPYWTGPLPKWSRRFLIDESAPLDNVRYLLTFRPFTTLPEPIQENYLEGKLALLPFPGSLVFWGAPVYARLQKQMPFAFQLPLQRVVARHGGPLGIRVPQSGWLHELRDARAQPTIEDALLLNTYRRTNRWDRVSRYENAVALSTRLEPVTRVLFSTDLDVIGLYDKPQARNVQLWTAEGRRLLDGPRASRRQIDHAAAAILEGGLFRYRFQFPPMRVGDYEVYWQRPLVAYWDARTDKSVLIENAPLGYLTAYHPEQPDLSKPLPLYPRLLRRPVYLSAIENFDDAAHDVFRHETPLKIVRLLDTWARQGARPLRRSFAQQVLHPPKGESLDEWLRALPERTTERRAGKPMQRALARILAPAQRSPGLPLPITFGATATRGYETAFWNDMAFLSQERYLYKDNADIVLDQVTRTHLKHRHRDLEILGDYLLSRHRAAIARAGMQDRALCGELPFRWRTDFDFPLFGGWKNNQSGKTHERNLLVVIPGKNRKQAVVMADHYDTAYMEDVFDPAHGGSGARLAAPGADDNASATATLLQAAPILLELARQGKLERDVWLLHLTGEEFPADSMGARHFCRSLLRHSLALRVAQRKTLDLSATRIVGVFLMDMIAHNRDDARDIFQIAPGANRASLQLAYLAHLVNEMWNGKAHEWNETPERRDCARGKRSQDGETMPEVARHLPLNGQVRTAEDLTSTLYNTDGIIFSDSGVPVILMMENYDINRHGYHDSQDTMVNIDLDYGAALSAITIEAAAQAAIRPNWQP